MTQARVRPCRAKGCNLAAMRNSQCCEFHRLFCVAGEGCNNPRYVEPGTGRRQSYCMQHMNWVKKTGSIRGYQPREREWGSGWVDPNGYVRLHRNKRVKFQHREVMELHLGRELLPEETVHHINGNRSDNRIENLELWSTSQPYGQRVADKLEWARKIIEMYG